MLVAKQLTSRKIPKEEPVEKTEPVPKKHCRNGSAILPGKILEKGVIAKASSPEI